MAGIHFNELLDLSEDKDGGSGFQTCRLSSLPPPLRPLLLLFFQPFRDRSRCWTVTSSAAPRVCLNVARR